MYISRIMDNQVRLGAIQRYVPIYLHHVRKTTYGWNHQINCLLFTEKHQSGCQNVWIRFYINLTIKSLSWRFDDLSWFSNSTLNLILEKPMLINPTNMSHLSPFSLLYCPFFWKYFNIFKIFATIHSIE